MATINVTDASFASDVLGSDKPVLVDFWADWCGPCKMIAPALEEISEELAGQVTIAKMDIMENTDIPAQMGVQSIPLMVLFKDACRAETGCSAQGAIEGLARKRALISRSSPSLCDGEESYGSAHYAPDKFIPQCRA